MEQKLSRRALLSEELQSSPAAAFFGLEYVPDADSDWPMERRAR